MQDASRLEASIELLTQCHASWKTPRPLPTDILLNRYFKERRYIGSKDRGAISALVYFIIRNHASLSWWLERSGEATPRALVVAALMLHEHAVPDAVRRAFSGEHFAPKRLTLLEEQLLPMLKGQTLHHPDMPDYARYNYPLWMEPALKSSLPNWKKELDALGEEAPVDLRTNTLLATRDDLLKAMSEQGIDVQPTPHSPIGIRMHKRFPVFTSPCFKDGWFEMQDEGSQLVSLLLDAKPGEKIIDFCAGAGGKTLALAAQMQNKGRILAWDTSAKRLDQMAPRLKRAKVDNVQRHVIESEHDAFIKRHKNSADAVLIDAPCSGSGTWRRNPDLKWRFRKSDLEEILAIQSRVLESASRLLKVGGRLLYVTCSVLESENERQVEAFLSHSKNFKVVLTEKICSNFLQQTMIRSGAVRLTPHQDGTDGFFAYLMQRSE